jgi:hypothetical protein
MKKYSILQIAAIIVATPAFITAGLTNARAAERNCSYQVRVKSDDGIGSITIPNGNIVFKGKATNTNNNRGFARFHAADGAEGCLRDALRGGPLPPNCLSGAPLRSNAAGQPVNFNLQNAKTIAYDALCRQAAQIRRGNARIRGAQIYTFVGRGSADELRECSLPASSTNVPRGDTIMAQLVTNPSRYKVWSRDNIECSGGRYVR